ncbi:HlyU family transcriptional regulator [Amphritea sp. HPY]|uniref:HlyU family transcriptional regulator n=1 Tax=Amphritea sp. HPY TaxID=3421652 RepID=UPI003D7DD659
MSLFSSIKSMFSGGETAPKEPESLPAVEYNGFTITPAPVQEAAGFRINGAISKGELSHAFIRADTLPSAQMCADEMVRKAKQMIDQQGDRLFG